jgi:hypothetical protein
MKNSILLLVFLFLTVSFYGCPYESAVAIDEPNIKIDKVFLGNWTLKNTGTKYVITKLDDYHLKIKAMPTDTLTKDTTFYNAHFSKIKDMGFLNIVKKTNLDFTGKDIFYLYKYSVNSPDEIAISELSSNIKDKFTSSDKLKNFIAKYMDLSFFYGNEEIYVRE